MDTIELNGTYMSVSLVINAIFFIILPLGIYKYYTRRKKVSCWFCNHLQVVNHTDLVCWSCDQCHQYNGFNQDGDYNINNPAFYDESLNPNKYCISQQSLQAESSQSEERFDNGLCDDCNIKQKMKVKLLNEFTPFNDDNFDSEYQEYSSYVDALYGLCAKCTLYAENVLKAKNRKYGKMLRFSGEDEFDDGEILNPDLYKSPNQDSKSYRKKYAASKKSRKSGLSLKVIFLELIVVTCSITLLLCNVYDLDQDCNLNLFSWLPRDSRRQFSVQLNYRLHYTVIGLLSSLCATHLCGNQLLSSSDVVSLFFWMSLQFLHVNYASSSVIGSITCAYNNPDKLQSLALKLTKIEPITGWFKLVEHHSSHHFQPLLV